MKTKKSMKMSSYLNGEYTSYSGRGMSGRSCPGFIYDDMAEAIGDILAAMHDAAYETDFNLETDSFDLLFEELKHVEFDLIGLRTIAYFPYLPAEEPEFLNGIAQESNIGGIEI